MYNSTVGKPCFLRWFSHHRYFTSFLLIPSVLIHIISSAWLQCFWLTFRYFSLISFHSSLFFLIPFFLMYLHSPLLTDSLSSLLSFPLSDLLPWSIFCSQSPNFVLCSLHFNSRQYHPKSARDGPFAKAHWRAIPNIMTMSCVPEMSTVTD